MAEWRRRREGGELESPEGNEGESTYQDRRGHRRVWKAEKGGTLGMESLEVSLDTCKGNLGPALWRKVASCGEHTALGGWKIGRLERLRISRTLGEV